MIKWVPVNSLSLMRTQVYTVGHTWIEQSTVHPDVLSMTIGGDW